MMSALKVAALPRMIEMDPYSTEVLLNPYEYHDLLREAGPVAILSKYDVYATGRHAEAAVVLSDFARFTSTSGTGIQDIRKPGKFRTPSKILDVDPPAHTAVRAALTKILTPIVIRKWRDDFAKEADVFVDRILDMGEFNGVEDFCEPYVMKVFAEAVGVQLPRIETLAIGEMRFNQTGPANEIYHRAMKAAEPYLEWFERARQRENMTRGSIGEMFFEAEERGDLQPGYASNLLLTFVGGGTDSSISGIGTVLRQLASNSDQWAIAKANPTKMKSALDEAIRFDTPFQIVYRCVVGDTELSGVRLEGGKKIGVFLGAVNRDPRKWHNPDKFDLDRQAAGVHLAFGVASHMCIGQMIARLESESLLTALVKRAKSIELVGTPTYRPMNQLRTLESLPLKVTAA
jgi:4-methoxybenzoate monooxygenase (O-demethylating)